MKARFNRRSKRVPGARVTRLVTDERADALTHGGSIGTCRLIEYASCRRRSTFAFAGRSTTRRASVTLRAPREVIKSSATRVTLLLHGRAIPRPVYAKTLILVAAARRQWRALANSRVAPPRRLSDNRQFRSAFQIVGRSMIATRATERETMLRDGSQLVVNKQSSVPPPSATFPGDYSFPSSLFALASRHSPAISRFIATRHPRLARSSLLIAPLADSV